MAYVLGYFAADGSMIPHKKGGCYIEFTSTDRSLLVNLKKVVGSTHKISLRGRKDIKNHKQQYRL